MVCYTLSLYAVSLCMLFLNTDSTQNNPISVVIYDQTLCKGKAIPLQAWTGPEGSRRVRLLDFKTVST